MAGGYDQLFFRDFAGRSPIMRACYRSAPLELVQVMLATAKLDSRKRCLLAITAQYGSTAHRWARCDPAVLELLIREHPLAQCATDSSGRTPLQNAALYNRSAAITSLLIHATHSLATSDYAVLIFAIDAVCCENSNLKVSRRSPEPRRGSEFEMGVLAANSFDRNFLIDAVPGMSPWIHLGDFLSRSC